MEKYKLSKKEIEQGFIYKCPDCGYTSDTDEVICNECGGVIPDVMFGVPTIERGDCKNHNKPDIDIRFKDVNKFKKENE